MSESNNVNTTGVDKTSSVAMITADSKPGGIGLAFNNYTARLLELGEHVHVMVRPEAFHIKDVVAPEVEAGRVTVHHVSKLDMLLMKTFGYAPRRLRRVLKSCRAVINHTNSLCAALAKSGTPVISVSHSGKWRGLDFADRVICISRTQCKLFEDRGIPAGKAVFLPHYFETDLAENPYTSRRHIPLTIAAAGRFVDKKGFEDFIHAAARIQAAQGTGPAREVRFVLAGDGPKRGELMALNEQLGSPVSFVGWVDIRELATSIDVFCLPSYDEPFGYVLCEMMSYGVPCISSNTYGPKDILANGEWGMMYTAGDVGGLVGKLESLLQVEDILDARLNTLSEMAWKRIGMADFSIATFNARLSELLAGAEKD